MLANVEPKVPEFAVAPLRACNHAQAEILESKRRMLLEVIDDLQSDPDTKEVADAAMSLQLELDHFSDIEKLQKRAYEKIDRRLWLHLDAFKDQEGEVAEVGEGSSLDI